MKFAITTILLVIVIIFSVSAFASSGSEADSRKSELIKNFHDVEFGRFSNISDQVSAIFDGMGRDEALVLLDEAKFDYYIQSNFDEIRLDEVDKGLGIDQKVIATRGPGLRFWRIFTEYRISLSIKNDAVVRTVATVDSLNILP